MRAKNQGAPGMRPSTLTSAIPVSMRGSAMPGQGVTTQRPLACSEGRGVAGAQACSSARVPAAVATPPYPWRHPPLVHGFPGSSSFVSPVFCGVGGRRGLAFGRLGCFSGWRCVAVSADFSPRLGRSGRASGCVACGVMSWRCGSFGVCVVLALSLFGRIRSSRCFASGLFLSRFRPCRFRRSRSVARGAA